MGLWTDLAFWAIRPFCVAAIKAETARFAGSRQEKNTQKKKDEVIYKYAEDQSPNLAERFCFVTFVLYFTKIVSLFLFF